MGKEEETKPPRENPLMKFREQANAYSRARHLSRVFGGHASSGEIEEALRPLIKKIVRKELRRHGITPKNDPA